MSGERAIRFGSRGFAGVTIKRGGCEGEPVLAGRSARKSSKGKSLEPSADLERIVGHKPLPRSQVVSKVWDHIRKNNLQNPKNKREIMADAKLKPIFGGKDRVSMFEMNKHLSNHLTDSGEKVTKKQKVQRDRLRKSG